jgi:hypothetical protein
MLLGDWLVAVFRMSTFEGGAGYLMVFFFTPLAFVGGLIVGALTVWRLGPSGYFKMQGLALLMTVALFWAVVALSYLFNRPQAPPPPLSEAEKKQALIAEQAERARAAKEEEAKFQGLSADSSLQDYLDAGRRLSPFDNGEDKYQARQEQVLAGAARVKSRQGDAIDLLNQGQIGRLEDMWRYSLSATPELCTAYNRAFVKYSLKDRPFFVNIIQYLTRQLPNLKWLAGEHCNVDESLAAFTETLQLGIKATDPIMQERLHIASLLSTMRELRTKP